MFLKERRFKKRNQFYFIECLVYLEAAQSELTELIC